MTTSKARYAIYTADDAPQFYGGCDALWKDKSPEVMLEGPYECVAGETLIYDPTTGMDTPVEQLAGREDPITVLTMDGPQIATAPFKKGIADLYRVTTEDGRSFVATARHRVMTGRGWVCVANLVCHEDYTYSPIPLVSIREASPSTSRQDGRYLTNTGLDSLSGYSPDCRQHDGRLRTVQGSGLDAAPSQADAPAYSYGDLRLDDHETLSRHSHPHRQFGHQPIVHCTRPYDHDLYTVYRAWQESAEQSAASSQGSSPFGLTSNRRLSIDVSAGYQQSLPAYSTSSHDGYGTRKYPDYTAYTSTVSSVEYVRTDAYFDMHVPVGGHYFAEGFYHHNTGKTYAALSKLHMLLCKYPHCSALMVRKTRKSLLTSAVVTYENKVVPRDKAGMLPVQKYGGERPEFYTYPNGSKLTVGGLDDADKYLSAEYDYIYVNQAEELLLGEWEKLIGRATGRAGNAPYPQVIGDCNPGNPTHWILKRPELKRYKTGHKDNPSLYNHEIDEWTTQGKTTVKRLSTLTGLRYKRGFQGLWAGAEGQIYEWDDAVHHIVPFDIPSDWRRMRAIDFGFTNPFVCQWWAIDPDGRMYLYREIYMSQRTVRVHSEHIVRLSEGERYTVTVADHDAEDRATLRENGVNTIAADKTVTVGIEKVQERLKPAGDGRSRLFVLRDCTVEIDTRLDEDFAPTGTAQEFGGYVWEPTRDDRPNKDQPLKMYDHGMDALRYAVMFVDTGIAATGMVAFV